MRNEFVAALGKLQQEHRAFAMATVVRVDGSASARPGSRALFDKEGRNLNGWVGGGCAETFVGEQAVEAIRAAEARTVSVDLDDEIFGLGVVCGGRMEVFIDPHYPPERIRMPSPEPRIRSEEIRFLMAELGLEPEWTDETFAANDVGNILARIADGIASARSASGASLREKRSLPYSFAPVTLAAVSEALIVGKSGIAEALARYFTRMEIETTVVAPVLDESRYPSHPKCTCQADTYHSVPFSASAITIIASHHGGDAELVKRALGAGSPYVAVIGSRSRVTDIMRDQGWEESRTVTEPLFAPAGLDLGGGSPGGTSPAEIALSIVAEIMLLQRGGGM